MLKLALALCAKDLRIVLARSAGLAQALLLGLLLVFLFSLSLEAGDRLSPQAAATMFWLASAFCQVLVFNMLYSLEEENGSRLGLLTLPVPSQGIWLGKATFVFLGQSAGEEPVPALIGLLLTDVGMAASGSLLGALSVGRAGRESLLSIVLFPLMIPLLLAGIQLGATGFNPDPMPDGPQDWIGLAAAFDAVFLAAGLALFPFVYSGED